MEEGADEEPEQDDEEEVRARPTRPLRRKDDPVLAKLGAPSVIRPLPQRNSRFLGMHQGAAGFRCLVRDWVRDIEVPVTPPGGSPSSLRSGH